MKFRAKCHFLNRFLEWKLYNFKSKFNKICHWRSYWLWTGVCNYINQWWLRCLMPYGVTCVTSFTEEVNPRLAKCPLKTNGRLTYHSLTFLVKETTGPNELRPGAAFTLGWIPMKYHQHHKQSSLQRPVMEDSCCSLTLNKCRKQWSWFAYIMKYKHMSVINLSMNLMTDVWWLNTFLEWTYDKHIQKDYINSIVFGTNNELKYNYCCYCCMMLPCLLLLKICYGIDYCYIHAIWYLKSLSSMFVFFIGALLNHCKKSETKIGCYKP